MADQLGIAHHVFNFASDFEERVVGPYVRGHAEGSTPNPCIECNRHIKFERMLSRGMALGFDAVATGHHARARATSDGQLELRRAADPAKDQSYVLAMLSAGPAGADRSSRSGTSARKRFAPKPPGAGFARRPSPTVRTCASSDATKGASVSWAIASPCIGPARRWPQRRGPRLGGGGGTGHGRPATRHGPRSRRPAPLRDRRRHPWSSGVRRSTRGCPRSRAAPAHRHLGGRPARGTGSRAVVQLAAVTAVAQCSAHGRPMPCRVQVEGRRRAGGSIRPARAAGGTGPDGRALRRGGPRLCPRRRDRR